MGNKTKGTMGNKTKGRPKGKPKKKSIKAKVTSTMGSKRRLSRMGKESKKGMRGSAANYMTRSQILKRLQITLKDFRRLCILKGIYPRDPKKQLKGKHQTYYHIKDVSYLAHEPLLAKFREFKAFMRKVRRSVGRGELGEARRRERQKPQYTLHHLVRERYPRFRDALADLDDALCLVALFAHLPAEKRVRPARTAACQALMREWQFYVARAGALTKAFVSIKGVYFQAEVQGQPVTWVVPHRFTPHVPPEVDFRVMLTFLEFHEVLVRFVLFKLYAAAGLQYPPRVDAGADDRDAGLRAVVARLARDEGEAEGAAGVVDTRAGQEQPAGGGAARPAGAAGGGGGGNNLALAQQEASAGRLGTLQERLAQIARMDAAAAAAGDDAGDADDEEMGEALTGPLEAALKQAVADDAAAGEEDGEGDGAAAAQAEEDAAFAQGGAAGGRRLFQGLVLFLGREVPQGPVEFVAAALGARVGWDGPGSPFGPQDPAITHQVVDRDGKGHVYFDREYVQPQWVFDSANHLLRLPTAKYRPGANLPPHLSPFVDDEKEGYTPAYAKELAALKAGKRAPAPGGKDGAAAAGEAGEGEEEEEEEEEAAFQRELAQEAAGVSFSAAEKKKRKRSAGEEAEEEEEEGGGDEQEAASGEGEEESGEGEEDEEEDGDEQQGTDDEGPQLTGKAKEDAELHEMAQIMMSKKAKRLYGRMQHGLKKKRAEVELLEKKAQRLAEEGNDKQKKSSSKKGNKKTPKK